MKIKDTKIAMIGCGKLGQDCAEVMAQQYMVEGYDVEPRKPENFKMKGSIQEAVKDKNIVFIAAPTPHDPRYDGSTPTAHLEPKDFDKDLKSKLDKGDIFSFPFNYYADFKLEDGILLKGKKDYFALIGRKTTCNWVGEHSEDLPEEVEEFEDNDLDFEMM